MDFLLVISSKNVYFLSCSHPLSLSGFCLAFKFPCLTPSKNHLLWSGGQKGISLPAWGNEESPMSEELPSGS